MITQEQLVEVAAYLSTDSAEATITSMANALGYTPDQGNIILFIFKNVSEKFEYFSGEIAKYAEIEQLESDKLEIESRLSEIRNGE